MRARLEQLLPSSRILPPSFIQPSSNLHATPPRSLHHPRMQVHRITRAFRDCLVDPLMATRMAFYLTLLFALALVIFS